MGGGDGLRDEDREDRGKKTQTSLIRPSAEEVSFLANSQWSPSIPLFPCCRMCPRVGIHEECGPFCLACDRLLLGGHSCVCVCEKLEALAETDQSDTLALLSGQNPPRENNGRRYGCHL